MHVHFSQFVKTGIMENVLLVVSLHNESKRTKEGFRDGMMEHGWAPVDPMKDTFTKEFSEEETVRSTVKETVRAVARDYSAEDWDAIMARGESETDTMKIT